MTFYYYSPFPPKRHHRMERMMREMQPEGAPCCEGHSQPGMHRHMHAEGSHRHEFPIRLDVESREDAFVISAILPGLKPEDVNIQITEEIVSIQGEIKLDEDEKATWLLRERPRGRFSRSIELPVSLDAEKAKASFENGILTLIVPKAAEARPKTIKVNVK